MEAVSLIQRSKLIVMQIPHQKKPLIWMQTFQPNLVLSAFQMIAMAILIPPMSSKKDQVHGSGHSINTQSLTVMAMAMTRHRHTIPALVTARKVFSLVNRGRQCS